MLPSYPSIYNFGHAAVAAILQEEVIVEEKVDGSQISFGVTSDGEIQMRSKSCPINILAPEGLFKKAVEAVLPLKDKMTPGWVYRGEYLAKPKHNVLSYARIPIQHIIIYDIQVAQETYLAPDTKAEMVRALGFETVPLLFQGKVNSSGQLRSYLESISILGGQKIEGVVVKPAKYDLFGRDKKCLLAKLVSEDFKETHNKTWTKEHRTSGNKDIIGLIAANYTTAARWSKAVIHLKEKGILEGSPKDIGLLIKEVPQDIAMECMEQIQKELSNWAWPQIQRLVVKGLPEWYKNQLLKQQFEEPSNVSQR